MTSHSGYRHRSRTRPVNGTHCENESSGSLQRAPGKSRYFTVDPLPTETPCSKISVRSQQARKTPLSHAVFPKRRG